MIRTYECEYDVGETDDNVKVTENESQLKDDLHHNITGVHS